MTLGQARRSPGIRFGQPQDVEDLVRIWFAVWDDSYASLLQAGSDDRPAAEYLRTKFDPVIEQVIVTTVAGRLAGFSYRQGAEIEDLWIDPSHQGEGHGLALLNHTLSLIRADGHRVAVLDCIEANVRACRFYEREGWRQTSRFVRRRGRLEFAMLAYEKGL